MVVALNVPTVLVVAGFDPSCGAGYVADVLTCRVVGVYAVVVPTCIVVQDLDRVYAVYDVDHKVQREIVNSVTKRLEIKCIKVGVIRSRHCVELVRDLVTELKCPLVVDPIHRARDGTTLTPPEVLHYLLKELGSYITVLTPNIEEAKLLSGRSIEGIDDVVEVAKYLTKLGPRAVLVKGGHLPTSSKVIDVLYDRGSGVVKFFEHTRVGVKFHGIGCVLSSLIASHLAKGMDIVDAVEASTSLLNTMIQYSYSVALGTEYSVVNVLAPLEKDALRYRVLHSVKHAVELLERYGDVVSHLIPEVQMNLVEALPHPYARSIQDVVGIPGRIVRISNRAKAVSAPDFGASKHVARAVLTAMKFNPEVRSCANIVYCEELVKVLKELGYRVSSFNRAEEPEHIKATEGASIPWGIETAIRKVGYVPDAVIDYGDWGKEPHIYIFGKDAGDVVRKLIEIARRWRGSQ